MNATTDSLCREQNPSSLHRIVRRRVYVASSWRNELQRDVVRTLRMHGHEVYDFKNPKPGDNGFHWSAIDPNWKDWKPHEYRSALRHPIAEQGFASDWNAMVWADCCVLVLPCGRSAHIEAGYFVGAGKQLIVLLAPGEPELMYKMTTHLCLSMDEMLKAANNQAEPRPPR